MDVKFRFATPDDAKALLDIYAPYVENTTVSFEYDVPTVAEFRRRICEFSAEFPYIVCVLENEIVGYAYAHRYKTRHAYRFAAELSIYMKQTAAHRGLGKRLYGALISMLREMGYKNLYGIVTVPNPASFRLHTGMGFAEAGREHRVGYKFGKWIDTVLFELCIGERNDSFAPCAWTVCPKTVGELGVRAHEILKEYEKSASSVI